MQYKGYTISNALPTGGKAGKGCNKTSTIQVLEGRGKYRTMLRQVRYTVAKPGDFDRAVRSAMAWVDAKLLSDGIDLLCKQSRDYVSQGD